MSDPKHTIPIQGRNYLVRIQELRQEDLRFYPDNPRIYSVLHNDENHAPSQEEIEECLKGMEHVRELRIDIEENGGLIEPLFVKEKTLEVVEGNSRLAAYRILADTNAVKWEKVKCAILPTDIDDSAIASLLGQLHLKGKKDWRPYEQAAFLHRRHYRDKVSITDLSKEIPSLKYRTIKHRIAVIDYMIQQGDNTIGRWSHYDEFLKSRAIQEACKNHAGFEEAVVGRIKAGKLKAQEVRDKLKVVCRTKSSVKQVISDAPIDEALHTAKTLGGDHTALNKIKRFRKWFVTRDAKRDIKDSQPGVKNEIKFELQQIANQIEKFLKAAE